MKQKYSSVGKFSAEASATSVSPSSTSPSDEDTGRSAASIFTSLLLSFGVSDAVVCPGSRNGALVHNLYCCQPQLSVWPVTDERSAGFVALGIALRTGRTTVVCVTSGSALLNVLPAVAEAYYQHVPLLVVSADRPEMLLGQLDGQTLPQVGALQPYTPTIQLPELRSEADAWHCNRLMNEALLSTRRHGGRPVHINIPLTPPLFRFEEERLPEERLVLEDFRPAPAHLEAALQEVAAARCPALLIGQSRENVAEEVQRLAKSGRVVVLPELLSNCPGTERMNALRNGHLDLLSDIDLLISAGGNLINKDVKERLRLQSDLRVIRIEPTDAMPDTFFHLHRICRTTLVDFLAQLHAAPMEQKEAVVRINALLENTLIASADSIRASADTKVLRRDTIKKLTDTTALQLVAEAVAHHGIGSLHLANSSVVRNAQPFFDGGRFPILCNRGVNGIEGSMSAAAGYSLRAEGTALLCIGDLSFFYDVNALWNTRLDGRLRVVLLNNGGGGIFRHLPGLSDSPAHEEYIAGRNCATAEGICLSYNCGYLHAATPSEASAALHRLLTAPSDRPQILELFVS